MQTKSSLHFVAWIRIVAAILFAAGTARADDRSLTVPTGWYWFHGQSPSDMDNIINSMGQRIIDIEVENASPLIFSAAFVSNSGAYASGWWWYYGQTEASLNDLVNTLQARITDLEAYEVNGETRFAALLAPNTGADAKGWWWYYGADPDFLATQLSAHNARLIDLDTYTINGQQRWSGVMIENTGSDASGWWWYYGLSAGELANKVNELNARIVDIEVYGFNHDTFAVILMPNTGAENIAWWWYYGVPENDLNELTTQNGARIVDIETYFVFGSKRFAALMVNNSNDLTSRLASILGYGSDGWTGVYLKEVGGSVLASLDENRVFEPASTIKAIAHLHAMLQVQNNNADLDDLLPWCSVSSNAQSPKDGCPNDPCNETIKLRDALKQMMWVSDNRATDAVIRHFGRAAINNTAAAIGMASSSINHRIGCGSDAVANPDKLTLTDIGLLYEKVATGILDADDRQTFYDLMAGKDTTDFSGVWGDLQNIIDQEGGGLGLPAGTISDFKDGINLSYKAGGYSLNNLTYTSLAGWVEIPFCSNGHDGSRQYDFGFFIHGASNSTGASNKFGAVRAEILREQVRAGLASYSTPCLPAAIEFVRGDANLDRKIDLSDAVIVLNFLFLGGSEPRCLDAADVNDSGKIDISDPSALLNFLFLGGSPPPGARPGAYQADATLDRLGCETYPRPPVR